MNSILTKSKNYLFVGYAIIIGSLLLMVISTNFFLGRADQLAVRVQQRDFIRVVLTHTLYESATERLNYYLLLEDALHHATKDKEHQQSALTQLDEAFNEIDARYYATRQRLSELVAHEDLRAILQVEESLYDEISKYEGEVLGLVKSHRGENATELLENVLVPKQRQLIERLARLSNKLSSILSDTTNKTKTEILYAKYITSIISLLIIMLTIFIGMLSAHKIGETESDLISEKDKAHTILNSINDAVITVDNNNIITYINPVGEVLTGFKMHEAIGQHISVVLSLFDEHTLNPISIPLDAPLQLSNVILHSSSNAKFTIEIYSTPLEKNEGVVITLHDTTKAKELAKSLERQVKYDPLTGLLNRTQFERQLQDLIKDARTTKRSHAILFMDLDQFKIVNDTCGHQAGDKLLRDLTFLLQKRVRDTDMLARLGGDEFGVLLTSCTVDQAQKVANDLRTVIQDFRFTWEGNSFVVTCSIGIVAVTTESDSYTAVLSAADAAMYSAKDRGRNRIYVFEPDKGDIAKRHGEMQWVSRITKAFEEDRFKLMYQPIQPIYDNTKSLHLEILVRMIDENGDIVPPMAFIPAAERYNLMPTIDRMVVQKVFEYISRNQQHILDKNYTFAINLSGSSINDEEFFDYVREQFYYTDIPPRVITFEITETTAIANLMLATEFIKKLRALGCKFALDDFGSGLSSFAYLKTLPVDMLKIDGTFVKDIARGPIDYAMVESINQVGHTMGLETIAEFVESEEIYNKLAVLKVDYAQGYHISRPRALDTLIK